MDNYFSKENPKMIALAHSIRGVTRYGELTLTVDVTEACHRSVFLTSRRPMPIGSVGGLALSLPTTTDQVALCIVTNFLEQNQNVFGIGAYVSPLTTVSRAHWGRFCQLLASDADEARQHAAVLRPHGPCRVLSFERALSPSTQLLLRSQGIEVADLYGESDLIRMTLGQYTQILVAEQHPSSLARLHRSLRSFDREERPSVIVLSREALPSRSLEVDPVLGPCRLLHVPCSREVLVQRLIHILWTASEAQGATPMSRRQTERIEDALTAGTSAPDIQALPQTETAPRFASIAQSAPDPTDPSVLAPAHRSRFGILMMRLWRQVRMLTRVVVDDGPQRRTAWHGAGG